MVRVTGIRLEEFQDYLAEYRAAEYFAAIKAGGECLDEDFRKNLNFLHKFGLYPLGVHGGGRQIDDALKKAGIPIEKKDGKRITDEATLEVVIETLLGVNRSFEQAANEEKPILEGLNGVFYVDGPDDDFQYVGEIIGINKDAIDQCIARKRIPFMSSLAKQCGKNWFNQNADTAFGYLVDELKPKKVLLLMSVGGFYKNGALISDMKRDELEIFANSPHVSGGAAHKAKVALELVRKGFDVQITSPKYLIEELFSKEGHGTYLHADR